MKTANTFSENLRVTLQKLMSLFKINMNQLHKKTGVPLTTINRIINDSKVNPTISSLMPLADFFGVTLNQIMGIDPLTTDFLVGQYAKKNLSLWTDVPVISWEDAALPPHTRPPFKTAISTDIDVGELPFALIIHENNWEGFFINSILIVNTNIKPEHGDYVVTLKNGQLRTSLKQILIDDDKSYLRPVNKDYQTQIMDLSYKIIGVVIQVRLDRN